MGLLLVLPPLLSLLSSTVAVEAPTRRPHICFILADVRDHLGLSTAALSTIYMSVICVTCLWFLSGLGPVQCGVSRRHGLADPSD